MKQFLIILKFELQHYFKNKIFAGITIFLVLAIGAVMFFPGCPVFLNMSLNLRNRENVP